MREPDTETGTSYFGVHDPEHAKRDLDRFRESGLGAVLHTFSERARTYHRENVRDIVDASHDRGFTVYVNPWSVGGVFGGEEFSNFVAEHPDARQRLNTGDRAPAACFNHPAFREFVREWTRDAAGLGADVLFWDEPHWYNAGWVDDYPDDAWSCRCEHCRERYRDRYDGPMPATETERVSAFREASLLDFLDEVMALTHDEGAENAVCLMPRQTADYGLRDWSELAASDHLDRLATDPYWEAFGESNDPEAFVSEFGREVTDLADEYGLRSQLWIQGFALDDGSAPDDVRAATRTALDADPDSVFLWGYDGCRTVSEIACAEPMAVWDAYLSTLP